MKRARLLAPSRIMRHTIRKAGGGRHRGPLVEKSWDIIAAGSKSFAAASMLFDRKTRERVWMLYAWWRCGWRATRRDLKARSRVSAS